MCGGTIVGFLVVLVFVGLSPRVRGNQSRQGCRHSRRRSIPACAGEPVGAEGDGLARQVYPRVCGGTSCPATSRPCAAGLSPRVRGNLKPMRSAPDKRGSIPACAGEPVASAGIFNGATVYPRVCGGTIRMAMGERRDRGLSPRVRGNLPPYGLASVLDRSIPACAGEPMQCADVGAYRGVYPRVCGGTIFNDLDQRVMNGLSPRVRGNHRLSWPAAIGGGSIPACAGEPR